MEASNNLVPFLKNQEGGGAHSHAHFECTLPLSVAEGAAVTSTERELQEPHLTPAVVTLRLNQQHYAAARCALDRWMLTNYHYTMAGPGLALFNLQRSNLYAGKTAAEVNIAALPPRSFALPQWNLFEADPHADTSRDHSSTADENTVYHRVLLLGLGGGVFHRWFLNHELDFPQQAPPSSSAQRVRFIVDSVEISEAALGVAVAHFGLGPSVCRVLKMEIQRHTNKTSTAASGAKDAARFIRRSLSSLGADESLSTSTQTESPFCRSTIILGDAWEYLTAIQPSSHRPLSELQLEEMDLDGTMTAATTTATPADSSLSTPPHRSSQLYDIVFFDVYDHTAHRWDGETDVGECNSYVDTALSPRSLRHTRALLTPEIGMAFYHLARDRHFARFAAALRMEYGASQLVFLRSQQNDYVILAAKSKFQLWRPEDVREEMNHYPHRPQNPCASQQHHRKDSVDGQQKGEVQQEDVRALNAPYMKFADWVRRFTSQQHYPPRARYGNMFALDCTFEY